MTSQINKLSGMKRCGYRFCKKLLSNTFRKDQKFCNSFCGKEERYQIELENKRATTQTKSYIKHIYDEFRKSAMPLSNLTAPHQVCVKYHILSSKPEKKWKGRHKQVWLQSYNTKHKKDRALNRRINYHLFTKMSFAKFWGMVEHG